MRTALTAAALGAALSAARLAVAQPPPQVCLLYGDTDPASTAPIAWGGLDSQSGRIAVLANLSDFDSAIEGISTRVDAGVFATWAAVGATDADEMVLLTLDPDARTARESYVQVQRVPGTQATDYVGVMSFDAQEGCFVGVVDGYNRNNTPFLMVASWARGGQLVRVWEDMEPIWETWAGWKYGVSSWDAASRSLFIVAVLPTHEAVVQFRLPLSGATPAPALFAAPTAAADDDVLGVAFSPALGGLVVLTADDSGREGRVVVWRQAPAHRGAQSWEPLLRYPTGRTFAGTLGSLQASPDGRVAVSVLQDGSGRFSVSWVDLLTGNETARQWAGGASIEVAVVAFCGAAVAA
jgi:hypothetical protein